MILTYVAWNRESTSWRYDKYLQWKWICSALPPTLTSVVTLRISLYTRTKRTKYKLEFQTGDCILYLSPRIAMTLVHSKGMVKSELWTVYPTHVERRVSCRCWLASATPFHDVRSWVSKDVQGGDWSRLPRHLGLKGTIPQAKRKAQASTMTNRTTRSII